MNTLRTLFFSKLNMLYRILYHLQPLELLKKIIKMFHISKAVWFNQITYYPKFVVKFENDFAKYMGCKYGLSFCNGTSSIEAALFALNIKKGDEVLVPSSTFHASISPILNAGATPIFVDIDPQTLTISPLEIKNNITVKTKCLIVVHLWGNVAEMDVIKNICADHNIRIIEDASHAHGAKWNNQPVGSLGDIGCFSLQGAKAIAAGEGGMAVTNSKEYFKKMASFGHFDRFENEYYPNDLGFKLAGIGFKRRANPLGIALAKVDLIFNNYLNKKKNKNYKILENIFCSFSQIQTFKPNANSKQGGFFGGFPIKLKFRDKTIKDELMKKLREYGLNIYLYPYPMHHKIKYFNDLDYRDNYLFNTISGNDSNYKSPSLPETEDLNKNLLILDNRYLIFFPFYMRLVLKNTFKLIEKRNCS